MRTPLRILLVTALLAPALAPAQTTNTTVIGVPPSLQVMRLGPQLVTFVGGQANFDSLVNGLSLGTAVTLTTALVNGQQQVVTFTPQGALTPIQIAQTLETARQSLISRGVATPTAQQVAITLTGGVLPTQTGNVQVTGLLPIVPTDTAAAGGTNPATTVTAPNPNGTPSPAATIQGQTGAGGTTPPSPAQVIQNQRDGNISNTPNATGTAGTTTAPASVTAPFSPAAPTAAPTAPASGSPSSASVRTR